ncbi:chloride channel protein [Sphingomonas koreensis]|nr:chloride channel protein [Sphingomonas koreensis]
MPVVYRVLRPINGLRRRLRASEVAFILLAVGVGAVAGLLTLLQGAVARTMQHVLFALPIGSRLSDTPAIGLPILLVLPLGGAVLGGFSVLVRARKRRLVDAVEANALHGGRMSVIDSLIISAQTIISNGFGASVGLEAAYAQIGSAAGSVAGTSLNLRRSDVRNLVGAGAGAAIGAAFGAPLAGAFYAFEIVIGAYTPSAIAPIAAAALTGSLVVQTLGVQPYAINLVADPVTQAHHYLLYAALGAVCAGVGIALMQLVALVEQGVRKSPLPDWARPAVGGALLVPLALLSPQVLSSGHGALQADLAVGASIGFIALVFLAKCGASIVSLGFGFRGGLFFASLLLGTLLGHLFADALAWFANRAVIDDRDAALVGMGALAVAIVGGPMTMAMLILESTHDFSLTGAVIAASLVASTIVRELFGYSFSTWRLHLRGETIKSARDVGWMKTLTAGRMMRREANATPASMPIAEFRRRFPLGSTSRVVLTDEDGGYAGIALPARVFAENVDAAEPVGSLAVHPEVALTPDMDMAGVMQLFDTTGADELAVVSSTGDVLGLLSESFVRRRYAEELEKNQRELFGER